MTTPISKSLLGGERAGSLAPSDTETLAAATARLGVRVRELKAAGDHRRRVVQLRPFQVKSGLGIDDDRRAGRADQNISRARLGREAELVAEAVAAATGNSDAQKLALLLTHDERRDFLGCGRGQPHQVFVPLANTLRQNRSSGGF